MKIIIFNPYYQTHASCAIVAGDDSSLNLPFFLLYLKPSFSSSTSCNSYPGEICGFLCYSIFLFSWQLNEDFIAGTKWSILGHKLYSLLPVLVDLVVGKGWQSSCLLLGLRFSSGLQKCSQDVLHPNCLGCKISITINYVLPTKGQKGIETPQFSWNLNVLVESNHNALHVPFWYSFSFGYISI